MLQVQPNEGMYGASMLAYSGNGFIFASSNNILSSEYSWIVDTSTSDHITQYSHLFTHIYSLPKSITITLLDGCTK